MVYYTLIVLFDLVCSMNINVCQLYLLHVRHLWI